MTSDRVHEIGIDVAAADVDSAVQTYKDSAEKVWITATVTIDGTTFDEVGLRLKGNSSLRDVSTDTAPEHLPWLVRLDKFVEQDYDGLRSFVIRSNTSESSLNEAVALSLLRQAGLAGQSAVAVGLSVNDSEPAARLVIDNPDDAWMEETFGSGGALYKAEASGDYSYRGDDSAAYEDVFDQEAGEDNTDLTPLIEFLKFVDESSDEDFVANLESKLDVDSFATYLAIQDLLDNFDDIEGPGNNSYLYWDAENGQFTVVPWDYNLAFGQRPGGAPGGDAPAGGAPGGGAPPMPDGAQPRGGGGGGPAGGGPSRGNTLASRFRAITAYADLIETKSKQLQEQLIESGDATATLDAWVSTISAAGLVDDDALAAEAQTIRRYLETS